MLYTVKERAGYFVALCASVFSWVTRARIGFPFLEHFFRALFSKELNSLLAYNPGLEEAWHLLSIILLQLRLKPSIRVQWQWYVAILDLPRAWLWVEVVVFALRSDRFQFSGGGEERDGEGEEEEELAGSKLQASITEIA